MKYAVPVQVVIEVKTAAEAHQAMRKIEELLGQSIVRYSLRGKGVELVNFKVEAPEPTW